MGKALGDVHTLWQNMLYPKYYKTQKPQKNVISFDYRKQFFKPKPIIIKDKTKRQSGFLKTYIFYNSQSATNLL